MYIFGLLLSCILLLPSTVFAATGVLIVAHGTSCGHDDDGGCGGGCCPVPPLSQWEQSVVDAVDAISNQIPAPTEVAFGMWETHKYDAAIDRLNQRLDHNLDRLVVIPLFISRHSIVIDMQRFIFRQTSVRPAPIPAEQIQFSGQVVYGDTIDFDPLIAEILKTRAESLRSKANIPGDQTEIVIAMHGPVEDHEDHLWRAMGHRYAAEIATQKYGEIHVVSLRDDAEAPVRQRATELLRQAVDGAASRHRKALVLPLLVAPGGIEAGIHERLQGLDYVWTGETLLPDPRLGQYLLARITKIL